MQATRGTPLSDDADPQPIDQRRRTRSVAVFLLVAAVAYVLDQVTKAVAVAELSNRSPIELVNGLLTLRLTRNSGAAFSIGTGSTVVFTVVSIVVVAVILRTARRLRSTAWAVALGLLLGGALGNLTDRMLRAPSVLRGHVVDFLELPNWPVFNVADIAITSSAVLIVLLTLLGRMLDGSRASPQQRGE